MLQSNALLELIGITKVYPGVTALDDISLRVERAEVLGLIGENGAGKSTLMKILGGVEAPTAGTIRIDRQDHAMLSVNEAMRAGIAFVHQELNLFDNLDVAANVFIGREPLRFGLVNRKQMRARVAPLLARLGADFEPDTPVEGLSIAQRQLVEIAKALSLDARIIIMDEPTSSLTLRETERLLKVIEELRIAGVSVIYISHRLGEVKSCANRVICLRDGRVVGELAHENIDHSAMIQLMIGRDLKALYVPPARKPHDGGFEIRDVIGEAFPDRTVDLSVRRGEILGLAGLVGSGRTSLARAIFGIDRILAGQILLDGTPMELTSPRHAIRHGIYLVPEDRKRSGLILDMPIVENITLANLIAYTRMLLVRRNAELTMSRVQRTRLSIRAPGDGTQVVTLSGGNQQKVVLAKWLSMRPQVIIFDEPTRGVDVGAKNEIYLLMRELADHGVAILMISSDMEEVIGVSDRIAVMHDGTIRGILERPQFSEYNVLHLAIGQSEPH
ncbi:MAG: sugar ABC transporter ATP-binding protein [Rhodopila sp.]